MIRIKGDGFKFNQKQTGCLVFILIFFFFCVWKCTATLPPIKGAIFYGDGKTPVEDAYIICVNYKYPLSEAINVGGANRDCENFEVLKTDSNGKFRLSSYFAVSLRMHDNREFIIYKPGCSVLRYFQSGLFSFIDMNDPWAKKIKSKKVFMLPEKFDNESNSIWYVCYLINEVFWHFKVKRYLKCVDKKYYAKEIALFHEIYLHLIDDDAKIKSILKNDTARNNYTLMMERLRHNLNSK